MLKQAIVTINDGETLSDVANVGEVYWPVGIETDKDWNTNAITFQGSLNGADYFNVVDIDSMSEYKIDSVAAGVNIPLKYQNFIQYKHVKVRSGTQASPANQSGATSLKITLLFKG